MRHAETVPTLERPSKARTVHLAEVTAAEARDRVVEVLGRSGFSVLAEFDLADILRRRLGLHIAPHHVLEVCRPDLARRALAVASDASLLMPCKIGVWSEGAGATVGLLPAGRLIGALGREHLEDVAAETDDWLEGVLDAVRTAPPAAPRRSPAPDANAFALDDPERRTLIEALRRQIEALLAESAGTESHDLQHALAQNITQLEGLVRKLAPARAEIPDREGLVS
jgi:uncharacterized protein (DUF302 family)